MLRPLIDEDLSVVFYDLTTIRAEGLSEQDGDVRHFGMSKEGVIARQFMLGVVQTADGMPIYHEVFDGNAAEAPTLQPTLKKVLARYPHIRRLVVVADRGLLSLDNIEALAQAAGSPAIGRWSSSWRCRGGATASSSSCCSRCQSQGRPGHATRSSTRRTWQGHRLVVAHNPLRAAEQTQERLTRIACAAAACRRNCAGKLDAQDDGQGPARAQALGQRAPRRASSTR